MLAIGFYHELQVDELWIASGSHFRYIEAHDIAQALGEEGSRALLIFDSFSGCDSTFSFHGKGKKRHGTHG